MHQTYSRHGLSEGDAAVARTSGIQCSRAAEATPETSTGATRLIVAVCELVPRVAVTVAV